MQEGKSPALERLPATHRGFSMIQNHPGLQSRQAQAAPVHQGGEDPENKRYRDSADLPGFWEGALR